MVWRKSNPPQLYRTKRAGLISSVEEKSKRSARTKLMLLLGVPLLAIIGTLMNHLFLNLGELGFDGYNVGESPLSQIKIKSTSSTTTSSWCEQVEKARADLQPFLRITYPCERLQPAISAIVCMITDGATKEKASKIVFTSRDYINGALSLGQSLQGNIDPTSTHQLLLLREGFVLDTDDIIRLQSVGWIVGTAPNFPIENKYLPHYPRYKTTYTKVTAIGLSEYKCALLIDADALVVGDIKELMTCNVFQSPNHHVAGTLDWYLKKRWRLYNTGSILWRTSSHEMNRVFNLTKDPSFMRRYQSDQDFLNFVYPERWNNTLNAEIVALDTVEARGGGPVIPHPAVQNGAVVPLSWEYNAQTHVEVLLPDFWNTNRPTVRIIHFTQKKGWQCEKRLVPPPPLNKMPDPCDDEIPICYCREAHLFYQALERAEVAGNKSLAMTV